MRRTCWFAVGWGLLLVVASARADAPKGDFQVHDLSLWIVDSSAPQANARNTYASPFPPTVASTRGERSSATDRRVSPLGLLTFFGRPATDLDVDLRIKSGSFLSHWIPGESLPNRLRWAGSPSVTLVEKLEDETELTFVDKEHWFYQARQGEALFVRHGARAERFLAYDAELNLPTPIRLQGGPDKYTITNLSGATLHDVLISRATPEGRRVAWLDVLPKANAGKPASPAPGAKSPAAPAAKAAADLFDDAKAAKPAQPAKPAAGLFGVPAKPAAPEAPKDAPAADKPPAEKPAKPPVGLFGSVPKAAVPKAEASKDAAPAKPASGLFGGAVVKTKPVEDAKPKEATAKVAAGAAPGKPDAKAPAGVEVTLSAPLTGGELAEKTTKELSERLARAGLSSQEIELFVSQYASLLFEGDALVVMCRLDAGTLEDKMPLSIFPEPTKIVRVPIVVVRNVDPQIGGEVERLIAQLGAPEFADREAAQKRLLALGPLAFEPLKKAINHEDMEVVTRAERILLNQNQPAVGRQGTANAAPAKGAAAAPAAPAAIVNGVFKLLGK